MVRQSLFPETIFSLSSGRLPSGVAVIRLSGVQVRGVLGAVCGEVPPVREVVLRDFRDGSGAVIDKGLALFFEGPSSFTGEDCAEFHLHGGKAVVAKMLATLGGMAGLRAADAGEFTRRAFLMGKIDLTGAEALADLVDAETEAQRRFALANSSGKQRELYTAWRERIIGARALIEAELDFSDADDVPEEVSANLWRDMAALAGEIRAHSAQYHRAEIVRDGFKVAIVGAPNAGKSSLLNALARRDVAIVSDEPGTTRDVVSVTLDLDGMAVIVSDTAGIRDNPGRVEALGIERSFKTAREADLVVAVHDSVAVPSDISGVGNVPVANIWSKGDLGTAEGTDAGQGWPVISAKTGEGLDCLLEILAGAAREAIGGYGDILPSRRRHMDDLELAACHLESACTASSSGLELRAEELRLAAGHLGRITGKVDVEDLLDIIFSSFCIGK